MFQEEATGQDHRRFIRHSVRGEACLEPLDERLASGQPLQVMLQDIGRTGIKFYVDCALEPGSAWRMKFIRQGFAIGSAPLAIRHCEEVSEGQFHIGAQFMIEPYILNIVGVPEQDLDVDAMDGDHFDESWFTAPDALGA
ncbi:MAG: hypothetical protein OER86_04365 [Phycisphaerae bacterium]|nr:hypothetical protein [Phycisphaerae bacterium]